MIVRIRDGELAGEYPVDMGRLTNVEVATISRVSGAYPLEWEDRLVRGDIGMVVAIALVATCRRRGADMDGQVEAELWNGEVGGIEVDTTDEEDEEPVDPQNGSEREPGPGTPSSLSGESGPPDSDRSQTIPFPIGAPSSESSESRPSRSAG